MAIYKARLDSNYTTLPNETLRDSSISFEARGVLSLMLSLPCDWQIHKSWLVNQCDNCGKDKMTRIISELENAGYLRRETNRNESGQFNNVDWFVYPTPDDGKAESGKSAAGEPDTTKERVKQKKDNTNNVDNIDYVLFTDEYNNIIKNIKPNWSKVNDLSEKRKKLVKSALKQVSLRAKVVEREPFEYLISLLEVMASDLDFFSGRPSATSSGFLCSLETNLRSTRISQAIDKFAD